VQIAGRAYNTGHGGSKATSKWQWERVTLHAGFTKDLTVTTKLIRALLTAARASGGMEECQVRLQANRYRAGILDGHKVRQIRRLRLLSHSHSG
jgi:hypothetical protein